MIFGAAGIIIASWILRSVIAVTFWNISAHISLQIVAENDNNTEYLHKIEHDVQHY